MPSQSQYSTSSRRSTQPDLSDLTTEDQIRAYQDRTRQMQGSSRARSHAPMQPLPEDRTLVEYRPQSHAPAPQSHAPSRSHSTRSSHISARARTVHPSESISNVGSVVEMPWHGPPQVARSSSRHQETEVERIDRLHREVEAYLQRRATGQPPQSSSRSTSHGESEADRMDRYMAEIENYRRRAGVDVRATAGVYPPSQAPSRATSRSSRTSQMAPSHASSRTTRPPSAAPSRSSRAPTALSSRSQMLPEDAIDRQLQRNLATLDSRSMSRSHTSRHHSEASHRPISRFERTGVQFRSGSGAAGGHTNIAINITNITFHHSSSYDNRSDTSGEDV